MALGFGFRCGFLGLLHLEIVQERLRREYDMDIIATYPSVVYKVTLTDGTIEGDRQPGVHARTAPHRAPSRRPMVKAFVICPNENIGDMMALLAEKRGTAEHTETLDARRVMITSRLPLSEILIDFHDRIKSITRGYGSMDYEEDGYQESDMVKLDMLVNTESVGRFFLHRSSLEGGGQGTRPGCQAQGSHPAPTVCHRDSGGHRRQDRCARNRERVPQGRNRQVLWRRHLAQTQIAGEAEGR